MNKEVSKVITEATKKAADVKAKVETKVAEVKAEVKAPVEEKKVAPVKTTKAAPKKTAAKKTAKTTTEKKTTLVIQYYGKEVSDKEVIDKVKAAYAAESGKKATSIKTLNVYVKPEENAAYYVVNGKAAGKVDL